ncbi:metal-dependent transcriptional regulator [Microbacterium sp. STN6]|uniref:metal-dependent transcriptional regulator n=1 Tax=Microbacterium sp. STN6 TaxID=2995588 RepID=UPI002260F787|nr:metal-dependent transcriptional regulator [Microbacterium sp. STN6]MCX7520796.1 metal-dependent transcriptional regulator [Microbacterium sp. STN6]
MSVSQLTNAAQDYLKAIWSATEWSPTPITVTQLAERMGVRAATVSDGIRRLVDKGLLEHEPYGSIELTEEGRVHAVSMVRRHRLLETFLVELLDYDWTEVHDEAEVLEHAVSDAFVERIDARLGHPLRDPHGDPIPTADGRPHRPNAIPLADAPADTELAVERVSDADHAVLASVGRLGIRPGAGLTVQYRAADAGGLACVAGTAPVELSAAQVAAVWVAAV